MIGRACFSGMWCLVIVAGLLCLCLCAHSTEVTYVDQIWRPCGADFNVREIGGQKRTAAVLDNHGKVVFEKELRDLVALDYSGGQFYTRRQVGVSKQVILLIDPQGGISKELRTERLAGCHILKQKNSLLVYGYNLSADGVDAMRQFVRGYSLSSGELIAGDLPKELCPRPWTQLLFRSAPPHVCAVGHTCDPDAAMKIPDERGSDPEGSTGVYIVGYDARLRETVREKVADGGHVEFVCGTDTHVCGVVRSKPERSRTVFTYEPASGSLRTAPLEVFESPWLHGAVMGDRLVVWGRQQIVWVELKTLKPAISRSSPGPRGYRLEPLAATYETEKVALVYNDAYHKRPARILVYDRTGEQLSDTALRPGWVEHLKFIGSDELLVFCRSYVARINLREEEVGAGRAERSIQTLNSQEAGRPSAEHQVANQSLYDAPAERLRVARRPSKDVTVGQQPEGGAGTTETNGRLTWLCVGLASVGGLSLVAGLAWLFVRKRPRS